MRQWLTAAGVGAASLWWGWHGSRRGSTVRLAPSLQGPTEGIRAFPPTHLLCTVLKPSAAVCGATVLAARLCAWPQGGAAVERPPRQNSSTWGNDGWPAVGF